MTPIDETEELEFIIPTRFLEPKQESVLEKSQKTYFVNDNTLLIVDVSYNLYTDIENGVVPTYGYINCDGCSRIWEIKLDSLKRGENTIVHYPCGYRTKILVDKYEHIVDSRMSKTGKEFVISETRIVGILE